jgi:hypothetical protein
MENKSLVLVVGAGASRELNLPVGAELKDTISKLLDIRFDFSRQKSGDHAICEALRLFALQNDGARDVNPYLHAAWHVRDAMPQAISIDNFIDTHQGDRKIELCGKLAIVKSILDAERNSLIFVDRFSGDGRLDFRKTEQCWLQPFFRLLTETCRYVDLRTRLKQVSFVIFNYDRCIEHYLYFALQNYYKISESAVAELLSEVEFLHR